MSSLSPQPQFAYPGKADDNRIKTYKVVVSMKWVNIQKNNFSDLKHPCSSYVNSST